MEYDGYTVLEAWKRAVNDGVIDTARVRPEVARAWSRCMSYGLNPWSSEFPKCDDVLLAKMRERHSVVMDAASPIMQYLLTIFNCNVSIADMHGFVFDLITPLSAYSRTLGTYVTESQQGSGNITMAIVEKKPVRVDGYEHFRAVAQSYSGVAANIHGKEDFVLCLNEPFVPLPKSALAICIAATGLVEKLYTTRREAFAHLSTAGFFDPVLAVDHAAVIVTDEEGMILTANDSGRAMVPRFEDAPYGSLWLGDFLKNSKQGLSTLMGDSTTFSGDRTVAFKSMGQRLGFETRLMRRRRVSLMNGQKHCIFVFENQKVEEEERPAIRRVTDFKDDCIGQSPAWAKVEEMVRSVAAHRSNVMIMGETGTGKEVVARALHRMSGRKGNFVALNCGALPRDLLASELFGYEGGAFTGARSSGAKGKFEYADGGTLFLDEIGDMPLDMQVSLLRVLQEQSVTRIGANKPITFDVRVVAATNQDMCQLIADGRFRSDLWYRLSVIEISLPRLSEREGDISLLAQHFNAMLSAVLNVREHPLSREVLDFLEGYAWPGNVRELRNVMEKALVVAGGRPVAVGYFPDYMKASRAGTPLPGLAPAAPPAPNESADPRHMRDQLEREKIIALLNEEKGNISRVAKCMGVSRNTLYRRIEKLNIQVRVQAYIDK